MIKTLSPSESATEINGALVKPFGPNEVTCPAADPAIGTELFDWETSKSGDVLSLCLNDYPKCFAPITIGLIKAGEARGILDKVLDRIAILIEEQEKIKSQIRAKVEHPFRYMKRMFGYDKVRYRGQAKNRNRFHVLAGFTNLLLVDKFLPT
mgnify:CR=1 FL=1